MSNDKITELNKIFEEIKKAEIRRMGNPKDFEPKIIYDGYIGEPEEFDKSDRILFVAAEANNLNGEGEKAFWVKRVINKDPEIDNPKHPFIKNINRLHKALMMYLYDKTDNKTIINTLKNNNELVTNYDGLKNIAFINLKKTGGNGKLNAPETQQKDNINFSGWVNEHKKLLYDEICLIDPKIIIVCGGKTQSAFEKIIKSCTLSDDITILYSYHPSHRCKAEVFLEKFLVKNEKELKSLKNK